MKHSYIQAKQIPPAKTARLRDRAEAQLRLRQKHQRSKIRVPESAPEPQRLLQELQVHQVELEMQNAELQESRNRMEALLEKFTDLYDFAPVGYLSVDEVGRIREINLTGAALLGVDRARLISRHLPSFIVPASRHVFLQFLEQIFAGVGKKVCEVLLRRDDGTSFWATFHGTAAVSIRDPQKWCRVVISDITALKRAEEAQRRVEGLVVSNEELREEIARRREVEESLKQSERNLSRSLKQSHNMQEHLRHLSRQVLQTQEEERKRISRELHDVIGQTLAGIGIWLATLKQKTGFSTESLDRDIARTQRLVEKSVDIIHQFTRELRPAVLDDLGLIPALNTFMKNFMSRTGVQTRLTAFAGVEKLDTARRTVFFRVAQEALTNVARHSHARRVEVSIQKLPDSICMKIKDDGKSFQVQRVLLARGGNRLGLLGMRERLEMVGGHFHVESAPGQGTTIVAQVPFGKARGRAVMGATNTKP